MDNGVQVHWKHFSGETLSFHSWVSSYVRPLGSSQTFGKFLLSHFPTFWRFYGCSRTLLPFLGSLCPLPWTSGIFLLPLHIARHSLFILPRVTVRNGSGFLHLRTSQALPAPRPPKCHGFPFVPGFSGTSWDFLRALFPCPPHASKLLKEMLKVE